MSKRIVILGDSLSMARPDDGITYSDTYAYMLYEQGYEVHNRSKRTNDTNIQTRQQNLLDDIIFLDPETIILFLGIVDCAPRIFTKTESILLKFLPSLVRNAIINFLSKHRYRITKLRPKTYVAPNDFEKNMEKIITLSIQRDINIILCTILHTNEQILQRSFNFKKNIEHYNQIIVKLANKYNIPLIDTNLYTNGLLDDGIHINKKMHQFIFKHIHKVLNS